MQPLTNHWVFTQLIVEIVTIIPLLSVPQWAVGVPFNCLRPFKLLASPSSEDFLLTLLFTISEHLNHISWNLFILCTWVASCNLFILNPKAGDSFSAMRLWWLIPATQYELILTFLGCILPFFATATLASTGIFGLNPMIDAVKIYRTYKLTTSIYSTICIDTPYLAAKLSQPNNAIWRSITFLYPNRLIVNLIKNWLVIRISRCVHMFLLNIFNNGLFIVST